MGRRPQVVQPAPGSSGSAGPGRQKAREERELTLRPRSPLASGHLAAGTARPSAPPPCRPPAHGGHRGGVPSGGRGGGREGRVRCSRFEPCSDRVRARQGPAASSLRSRPWVSSLPPCCERPAAHSLAPGIAMGSFLGPKAACAGAGAGTGRDLEPSPVKGGGARRAEREGAPGSAAEGAAERRSLRWGGEAAGPGEHAAPPWRGAHDFLSL